jgi:hypothetical protein
MGSITPKAINKPANTVSLVLLCLITSPHLLSSAEIHHQQTFYAKYLNGQKNIQPPCFLQIHMVGQSVELTKNKKPNRRPTGHQFSFSFLL